MSRATAFFRFENEDAAIAVLSQYRCDGEDGSGWDGACIDADIPIVMTPAVVDEQGDVVTPAVMASGYFVNLLTPARDESVEAIDGWLGTLEDDGEGRWTLVAGDHPHTPQRVFS